MKNKSLLLIMSLLLVQFINAQNENKVAETLKEFKNDTVNYIKQHIISRKNSYIGKPLDSLLKDLPIVLRYTNEVVHRNKYSSPGTTLYFSSSRETMDKVSKGKNPLMVTITWSTPLDNREFPAVGIKLWGGEWTIPIYNYYKNKIIGNIETFKDDQ